METQNQQVSLWQEALTIDGNWCKPVDRREYLLDSAGKRVRYMVGVLLAMAAIVVVAPLVFNSFLQVIFADPSIAKIFGLILYSGFGFIILRMAYGIVVLPGLVTLSHHMPMHTPRPTTLPLPCPARPRATYDTPHRPPRLVRALA